MTGRKPHGRPFEADYRGPFARSQVFHYYDLSAENDEACHMNVINMPEARSGGGFYTVNEAAKYLRVRSTASLRNWVFGNKKMSPVIKRQYYRSNVEIGFYDLMEVRFINFFRRHEVSLQSLRKAAEAARETFEQIHPFATSEKKFVTDRKRIFLFVAEETRDKQLIELTTGQHAFYDIVERSLAKGVEYDPSTDLPSLWRPEPEKYPNIELSPMHAFGHPVISRKHVPSIVLFRTFRAEGNQYSAVADWYEVSEELVREAIEFEIEYATGEA